MRLSPVPGCTAATAPPNSGSSDFAVRTIRAYYYVLAHKLGVEILVEVDQPYPE